MNNATLGLLTGAIALGLLLFNAPGTTAQNIQIQERLAEVERIAAQNKQALAQYTWQEQQSISINGEVKKREIFQVKLGPDGKPQRTEISSDPQQSSGAHRRFGLRGRIVEKKKEEYEDYAKQLSALAHSYAQPQPGRLQQLYQQGDATIGSAGTPGEFKIVVHNYLKPNDSVTLVFSQSRKTLKAIEVDSYLSAPEDEVNISAQYEEAPGGPNHISSMRVNGASKRLTIDSRNYNYQRM